MHAAVDHVHHRHGQRRRAGAAEIAVERHARVGRGGLRGRERDAEDRVRAEPALVRRAVELDQRAVERLLVGRVEPDDRVARSRRSRSRRPASTPLPPYAAPPSRSSTASCTPVDAPEGTAARPTRPTRAGRRPRRSGCRASRGSGGRGRRRSLLIRGLLGVVEVAVLLLERQRAPIFAVLAREPLRSLDAVAEALASRGAARAPDRRRACARR